MSYDIVKGLKLKDDVKEVWIKAASSNITPKSYCWEELKGLSHRYKTEGKEEIIKLILRFYWEGTFQPGTPNNFYKAVKIFTAKNPQIQYHSIGEITTQEICTCPMEDLPKYLNTLDRQVKEIVKRRLNGETVTLASIDRPVLITQEDFNTQIYNEYKNFSKRKKVKCTIKMKNTSSYVSKMSPRHRFTTVFSDQAMEFNSIEEANLYRSKYSMENLTEIIEKGE